MAKSNIMLSDELMPDRYVGQRTPEQILEEVVRYAENVIRTLEPGQSLLVERQDDPQAPWTLTRREHANGPLGPGDQDEYLNDGDYR